MANRLRAAVKFAQQPRILKKGAGRVKQIIMLALISILLSSIGLAQAGNTSPVFSLLPDSPSATERELREEFGNNPERETLGDVPPTLTMVATPRAKRARTFDRKFVTLQLFQLAAIIADVETTRYGLSHGAQESSVLTGRHPSVTSLYAISVPLDIGFGLWSYRLKKNAPHSRNWQIPPTMFGTAHGAAAIYNLCIEKPNR